MTGFFAESDNLMKSRITLITGGARSGKSNYAEKLAKECSQSVAYIATAIPFDSGMRDRIKKHKASRPKEWTTIEQYEDIYKIVPKLAESHHVVLLDCVTIMVTNLMFKDTKVDWDDMDYDRIDEMEAEIHLQFERFLKSIREEKLWLICVTNEVGMGIVPDNKLSIIFRDIAGRVNQYLAKEADEVFLTVSSIPVKIK